MSEPSVISDFPADVPRFLSWGCGLQSTTIGEMAARGMLPYPRAILTADLRWERKVTYEIRDFYMWHWEQMGLSVEILPIGDIRVIGAAEHVHIPFWTDGGKPLRRQCTRHFKVVPIKRRIREIIGYHQSLPPHPEPESAVVWLGISTDEWTRAKPSRVKFLVNRWPLLALKMSREDCAEWLRERRMPVPTKSSCIGCPYQRADEWLEIKRTAPEEWAQAIAFDEQNRENPLAKNEEVDADELYLWRECEPLATADLEFAAAKDKRVYGSKPLPFGCESGYCGV